MKQNDLAYATSAYAYAAGSPAVTRAALALTDAYALCEAASAERTAAWSALGNPDAGGDCYARHRAACAAYNVARDTLDAARLDYGTARDAAGV